MGAVAAILPLFLLATAAEGQSTSHGDAARAVVHVGGFDGRPFALH